MNHAKIYAGIALATLLLSGCASTGGSSDSANAAQESYNAAVVAAKSSIKTAKKANYEWRDSSKLLKKADKAAKSGDFAKATKLANKAKRQGALALAQSKDQANAGPR
jgi:outer membrane lipoprotein-sorting protein